MPQPQMFCGAPITAAYEVCGARSALTPAALALLVLVFIIRLDQRQRLPRGDGRRMNRSLRQRMSIPFALR